jgi:Domain of unknown function (DUF4260)
LFAILLLTHVGFDRALGYGLKYAAAFGHTHLGRIGKRGSEMRLCGSPRPAYMTDKVSRWR